jgi:hypothetical protein
MRFRGCGGEGGTKAARWQDPPAIKATVNSVDILKGGRAIFDIGGDKYRLVAQINYAQPLGLSLKEIAAIGEENRAGGISTARSIEIMSMQLAQQGPEPELDGLAIDGLQGACT